MDLIIRIIFGGLPFLLAIMLHEAAHALAAYKLGDPTARNMGRISLDPRRHFDPFGALIYVVLMVASRGQSAIGWAKPVPINPFNFRHHRRDFMLSSLAGPASNIVQAFVWAVALGAYARFASSTASFDPAGFMLLFGIVINVWLAVFNLIPIPPLDGSRVLAWILPQRYAHVLDRMERYGMLIVIGVVILVPGLLEWLNGVLVGPVIAFYLHVASAVF